MGTSGAHAHIAIAALVVSVSSMLLALATYRKLLERAQARREREANGRPISATLDTGAAGVLVSNTLRE